MAEKDTKYCSRCGKIIRTTEFYKSNNLIKHPDGYCDLCKQCMCAHVDNWDSTTYLPLLEDCDVPYIPEEWNKILGKVSQQSPDKITTTVVLGKYLAKMKLTQYKKYRYADSDTLAKLREKAAHEALEKQGKSEGEIQEILSDMKEKAEAMPEKPAALAVNPQVASNDMLPGLAVENNLDLTEEDISYLALKWGKTYQPFEWVQLEQLYQDMMASYDIQTAGHIDTLKMLCKTSLKANQLLDIGDIDGSLKMTKAYDTLMRSGNFTAVQNKSDSGEYIDSVGEFALMCEKKGYIEQYYMEQPNDKVDWVLLDMQNYTSNLVKNETNLNEMIERAMRAIEEDKNRQEDEADITDDELDHELFRETGDDVMLTDDDLIDFQNFQDELSTQDKKEILTRMDKEQDITQRREKKQDQIAKNKVKRAGIEERKKKMLEGVEINDGSK